MLEIVSPSIVAQVVLMTREFDRSEAELRAFLARLNEEEQSAIVALMWIGRGAFELEEAQEAFDTAVAEASTPTVDYLIGTPHLADHLEAALDAYGIDVSDVENRLM